MVSYMELIVMLLYIGMVGVIIWQQHRIYMMRRELGMLAHIIQELAQGNMSIESNGKHFKLTRIKGD